MRVKLKASTVAVAGALHAGVIATLAMPAFAQTAAKPEEQKVEKVEVTGSRIPSINLESPSPVTIVDAAAIKVDGVRSVENLLNNLPQVFADQGGNVSNGATGTATVNLRNLGATRTLVLVNGRRLPPGSPRIWAADLNQVPAPLIKRVEILTGGAGAVYGTDAVAGVVNFIMNDRFEGVQAEVNQSFYNHQQNNPSGVADVINGRASTNPAQFKVPGDKSSDGKITDANLLMGANFANGKGNATVFFNYKKEEALLQSERDFSSCALGTPTAAGLWTCGGSSTASPPRIFNLNTGASRKPIDAAGNIAPFVGANDQFNFAPYNYYQRPSERYGFNSAANYEVFSWAKLYSEFGFHDDHTVAQIAPSGSFFGGNTYNISVTNPLLSAAWKSFLFGATPAADAVTPVFIGKRNLEGGGRQDDIRHTSFRTVIGVKGDINNAWSYDVSMQTGKVIYQETYKNDFSNSRLLKSIDVVAGPGGVATCRSVIDGSDPNCVPYNIWTLGGITPAALAYVQTPGFQKGSTEQEIQTVNLAGDLGAYGFKFPMAKSAVGVSIGFERRAEKLQLDTDTAFDTGDLAGQGGPTHGVGGGISAKEYFGEIKLPIIEGGAFADLLQVSGSVRHSDYNTGKKADSYGVGLEWAPNKMIKLRGSYQRAVRAANVVELFTAAGLGLYDRDFDPCGPSKTASLAACQRTGLTAAQYGADILDSPAGQYNAIFGGNTRLAPEKSDSNTVGIVLEPMRNMAITLDFFDIKVKDVISNLAPTIALDQCLSTGAFCNLIHRDSIGSLWAQPTGYIEATNANLAKLRTSGYDIGFNYTWKINNYGSVGINFLGTLLKKIETTPFTGSGSYDCKGLWGPTCGTPSFEWRHKLRGTWTTPWNWDLSLTWRHLDEADISTSSSNAILAGSPNQFDRHFSAREYFDFAAQWQATKQLGLRVGINNLLDKDPPISANVGAGFGNGNTYPQVYDALGRRVFLNATYKF
jgi:outer membrane receptor protein involved in Fe transport